MTPKVIICGCVSVEEIARYMTIGFYFDIVVCEAISGHHVFNRGLIAVAERFSSFRWIREMIPEHRISTLPELSVENGRYKKMCCIEITPKEIMRIFTVWAKAERQPS